MDKRSVEEIFAPLGPVTVKRMFGGHGVYADGLFFALEVLGELYFKTDDATQPAFAAAGSAPFVYEGRDKPVVVKSYWRLPAEALEDEAELRRWATLALDAARRAAASKAPPARKRGKTKRNEA